MSYETEHIKTTERRRTTRRAGESARRGTERGRGHARQHSAARRRRRKKTGGLAAGIIVVVLIALVGFLGIEAISALSEAKGMLADVEQMKDEIRTAASCVLGSDSDGALDAIGRVDALAERDRETLAKPL